MPIYFVSAYLFVVFVLPTYLKKGFEMRSVFVTWNLLLSAFSFIGVSRTVPLLLYTLKTKGFEYTICEESNWFSDGPSGLWVMLFILSKIPELMDTVFLVLKRPQSPVLFLHWFHHLTVLLYCWHSYSKSIGPGVWFATMNYCVHSIMYLYYALTIGGYKKFTRPFASTITVIQILQMVVGMSVTVASGWRDISGVKCNVNKANYRMGFAMYTAYFFLFFKLYMDKYCKVKMADTDVCVATDKSGFFHNQAYTASQTETDPAGVAEKSNSTTKDGAEDDEEDDDDDKSATRFSPPTTRAKRRRGRKRQSPDPPQAGKKKRVSRKKTPTVRRRRSTRQRT